MTNVATFQTLRGLQQYLPDGVAAVLEGLMRNLPPDIRLADNLGLYASNAVSTTAIDIDTTAGAKPIIIIVQSTGTACWVHLHDAQSGSVTAGVDVDFLVPVAATTGRITALLCLGDSWDEFWNTGLTITTSTATETSAAPANLPNIWVVYAGS